MSGNQAVRCRNCTNKLLKRNHGLVDDIDPIAVTLMTVAMWWCYPKPTLHVCTERENRSLILFYSAAPVPAAPTVDPPTSTSEIDKLLSEQQKSDKLEKKSSNPYGALPLKASELDAAAAAASADENKADVGRNDSGKKQQTSLAATVAQARLAVAQARKDSDEDERRTANVDSATLKERRLSKPPKRAIPTPPARPSTITYRGPPSGDELARLARLRREAAAKEADKQKSGEKIERFALADWIA